MFLICGLIDLLQVCCFWVMLVGGCLVVACVVGACFVLFLGGFAYSWLGFVLVLPDFVVVVSGGCDCGLGWLMWWWVACRSGGSDFCFFVIFWCCGYVTLDWLLWRFCVFDLSSA